MASINCATGAGRASSRSLAATASTITISGAASPIALLPANAYPGDGATRDVYRRGAVMLFVLSARDPNGARRPLLVWSEARQIPWDVLFLFGGGLSLAAAMEATGLAAWIGESMTGLAGFPSIVIYTGLAVIVLVLSELASNTAVATVSSTGLAHSSSSTPSGT